MRLGRRRAKSDLLEAFKIINGQYDITLDTLLHLMMLEEEDIAKVIHEKKLIGYKEICICLTELWTTGMFLPDSCTECTTLNAFKTKIKLQLEPETPMLVIVDCIWR